MGSPNPSWIEAVLLVLFTFLVLLFAAERSPGAGEMGRATLIAGREALSMPIPLDRARRRAAQRAWID